MTLRKCSVEGSTNELRLLRRPHSRQRMAAAPAPAIEGLENTGFACSVRT